MSLFALCLLLALSVASVDGLNCYVCDLGEPCSKDPTLEPPGKEAPCREADWEFCSATFFKSGRVTRDCTPVCSTEGCNGLDPVSGVNSCCCKGDLCNNWKKPPREQTTGDPIGTEEDQGGNSALILFFALF